MGEEREYFIMVTVVKDNWFNRLFYFLCGITMCRVIGVNMDEIQLMEKIKSNIDKIG